MSVETAEVVAPTRRARLRAQTVDEIKTAARDALTAGGPGAIQVRPIARAVGLTAPALYRYFPSLEDLVEAVTVDLFDELVVTLEAARDRKPDGAIRARLVATSHAFRDYAVAHPCEFQLMFATPPRALDDAEVDVCADASGRFGNVFAEQFRDIWDRQLFTPRSDDELAPALTAELHPYWSWLQEDFSPGMPKGAVVSFLHAWVRLYGLVTMEVFGHIGWAFPDARPLLDDLLDDVAHEWGLADLPRT